MPEVVGAPVHVGTLPPRQQCNRGGGDTSSLARPSLEPPLSPLQTPEEERGLLHSDSNGYTNLPDVVQPSHSPTEAKSSNGSSSPAKDMATDVSG